MDSVESEDEQSGNESGGGQADFSGVAKGEHDYGRGGYNAEDDGRDGELADWGDGTFPDLDCEAIEAAESGEEQDGREQRCVG